MQFLNKFYCIFRLAKKYNSDLLNSDKSPKQLQNKVQFNIKIYMMRRGSENIGSITKNTFKLEYDTDICMAYV